jgi:hypothetical protein
VTSFTPTQLKREIATALAALRAGRRFAAEVGEAPLSYLTRCEMELAARRPRTSSDTAEASRATSATRPRTRSTAHSGVIAAYRRARHRRAVTAIAGSRQSPSDRTRKHHSWPSLGSWG